MCLTTEIQYSLADSRDMRQQIKLQIIMGPMNTCIDGV